MMRRTLFTMVVAAIAMSVGCASSPPKHAHSADDSGDESSYAKDGDLTSDDVDQSDRKSKTSDSDNADSNSKEGLSGPRKMTNNTDDPKNNPDPDFKENGSVDQAISAVPQGLPRENMEQDVLDKPLLDTSLYAPCKLSPANHFEIKFAVWNGRVVGLDIKSTPKSAKLEECVRGVVQKVTWREKTKSLNISTVMF
ncbi:MAG TPA: hypothetical protein VIV60_14065 [Polyangiaceae bacterium]